MDSRLPESGVLIAGPSKWKVMYVRRRNRVKVKKHIRSKEQRFFLFLSPNSS